MTLNLAELLSTAHRIALDAGDAIMTVYAGDFTVEEKADKLGKHDMVAVGSSLKPCLIAEGKADVYPRLGPTCLWDTGAAQAVVEQAGGRVETLEGQPLSYATPQQHLNPHFIVWGGWIFGV
jgi:3'-phosphoadenosine 5'-phosphosulfate (PAPS) 3'-phosphatase